MRSVISVLAMAAAIAGCTYPEKPMGPESAADMSGQSLTFTLRPKPPFSARTTGKALTPFLGIAAQLLVGNEIVASNNIDDPAQTIALGLAKELERSYAARLVQPPATVSDDDVEHVVSSVRGAARFIIDVQTTNWYFEFFPTDWTHYRIAYAAVARLIDGDRRAVVAEGLCMYRPDSNVNAPTYDELLGNGAARLKEELAKAADACVESIWSEMLSVQIKAGRTRVENPEFTSAIERRVD